MNEQERAQDAGGAARGPRGPLAAEQRHAGPPPAFDPPPRFNATQLRRFSEDLPRAHIVMDCEACGRDFRRQHSKDWVCPHCGHDNKRGTTRGKWFSAYCTERSAGANKDEARKAATEKVTRET